MVKWKYGRIIGTSEIRHNAPQQQSARTFRNYLEKRKEKTKWNGKTFSGGKCSASKIKRQSAAPPPFLFRRESTQILCLKSTKKELVKRDKERKKEREKERKDGWMGTCMRILGPAFDSFTMTVCHTSATMKKGAKEEKETIGREGGGYVQHRKGRSYEGFSS